MSAIKERTDGPGIEFGQIQGLHDNTHQLGLELEHADQIPAFGNELLEVPSSISPRDKGIVVFNSTPVEETTVPNNEQQLDFQMNPDDDAHHDSLWLNFQTAHHRNRSFLRFTTLSRRRPR